MRFHLAPVDRLHKELVRNGLGAAIVSAPVDFSYLLDLPHILGLALITSEQSLFYVDRRCFFGNEAAFGPNVRGYATTKELYDMLRKDSSHLAGAVGFDPATMTVEQFQALSQLLPSTARLTEAASIFSGLRRPKRPDEITRIERACALCQEGYSFILGQLREGCTEYEMASMLKAFWFSKGAEAIAFEPIIAFGPHSACPHWVPTQSPLHAGSVVLIDIGVNVGGYNSDLTRTVFFGPPDRKLEEAYDLVLAAYRLAVSLAKAGTSPCEPDRAVRDFFATKGCAEAFTHGLGHGVGLQIHEAPRLRRAPPCDPPLVEGDVITIEPGLYFQGVGGIRIETTFVIEPTGARPLMSLPTTKQILDADATTVADGLRPL